MIGLRNLGNTCFINAVLQCLLQQSAFTSSFYSNSYDYKQHINKHNHLSSKGMMVESFVSLMRNMDNCSIQFVSPVDFKAALAVCNPHLGQGFAQHDAAEFLGYLVDAIHEDLNDGRVPGIHIPSLTKQDELEEEKLSLDKQQTLAWKRWKTLNQSPVVDCFMGQLGSRLECNSCNYTSYSFSPFNILSIPVASTLKEAVQEFFKPEDIQGWTCSRCKQETSTKQLFVSHWPNNLIIQLKRFEFGRKIDSLVDFNLDEPLSPVPSIQYNLNSFVSHTGSLNFGHYKAYLKTPQGWKEADDDTISNSAHPPKRTAYLLFFNKITRHDEL
jgi:ubiquitin C-terminal hydrolase